jgi:anti-sigma factor RsiW
MAKHSEHDDFGEKLSAFLDGELDESESRELERRIADSPSLKADIEAFQEIDAMVRAFPKVAPSPDFAKRVTEEAMRAAVEARMQRTPPRAASRAPFWKRVLEQLSAAAYSIVEPEAPPSVRALDELGDCPPLSMSCAYLTRIGPGSGGF